MKTRKLLSALLTLALIAALITPLAVAATPTLTFLTEAVYDGVSGEFIDGLAWVQKDRHYAFINESGKIAIDWFDPAELFLSAGYPDDEGPSNLEVHSFREGYASISGGWATGNVVFIGKDGSIAATFGIFEDARNYCLSNSDLHEGYLTIWQPSDDFGGNNLCDFSGNDEKHPVLGSAYDGEWGMNIYYTQFHEGKCIICEDDYCEDDYEERYYYIDRDGKKISEYFEDAVHFYDGRAMAKKDGLWGVIDESCKFIVQPQFDSFWIDNQDYEYVVFSEGIAWVQKGGKWGAIDKTGKTVVPFGYYEPGMTFSDGMAVIMDGGKAGYVNASGELVIPAIYDDANYFYNGVALVAQGGTYKLIDKSGKQVSSETWQFEYTRVDHSSRDMVFYQRDGKWGIAKMTGAASATTPAAPALTAAPTAAKVLVNGASKSFDAYNIKDNNYFKLRDLAYVLSGTEKQFEVGYDESTKAITLTTGKAYTPVGGEMAPKGAGGKTPSPTASKIYLDGEEVSFTAYNIEGNNYFKLRDVATALDFYVGWDGGTGTITVDTGEGYTA
ncbi:MAG: WG repeat-containing protein [Oscillospiraceae bacterium]|jgi:hypothetical protein|nr:WG repeat-containing protein [Oscillospiraceae bacterium]